MSKMKEKIENFRWCIKAWLDQPIIYTRPRKWVEIAGGAYNGSNRKYDFYLIGGISNPDSYIVKVRKGGK